MCYGGDGPGCRARAVGLLAFLDASQGLDHTLILHDETVGRTVGPVTCRERLGAMSRCYCRKNRVMPCDGVPALGAWLGALGPDSRA
jgi:hypothetical protein